MVRAGARGGVLVLGVVALAVLAGCAVIPDDPASEDPVGDDPPGQEGGLGDTATWEVPEDHLLDPGTTFLVLEVTRLDCAGGVTGEVLEPVVDFADDRVEIRTDVAPLPEGTYSCQGNDAERIEVELREPLGVRELVDAACVEGEAVATAACEESVRWAPPPGLEQVGGVPDWEGPADYSFTVQSSCGEQAFIGEYAVTVAAGEVSAAEPLRHGWAEISPSRVPTIADMLETARGGGAEVWVDADGVPRWMDIDPMPDAIDDESCYLITEFEAGPAS